MHTYYFTFGQAHHTLTGIPMKDYYIRTTAHDYMAARQLMFTWAKENMGDARTWAFQYSEDQFDPSMYPKGAFAYLQ